MKKRLSIPLLAGSAIVIYAIYALVTSSGQIRPEPEPADNEARLPEVYAHKVRVIDYDEQGQPSDHTDAATLRRFAGEAWIEMDELQSWHFATAGPWQARAARGYFNERRDLLELEGQVQLRYDTDGVQFVSEAMTLNLQQRTARSPVAVRAVQQDNETRADGLFVDLDRQRATLTGSVVTVYRPEPGSGD